MPISWHFSHIEFWYRIFKMKNLLKLLCFLPILVHAQFVGPHCQLKVIKKEVTLAQGATYGIGIDGKPNLIAHESKSSSEEVSSLIVAQGLSSQIEMETTLVYEHTNPLGKTYQFRPIKNSVKILCKVVRFNSADLEIELVNTDKASLKTAISVTSGSKTNLGNIISELNQKDKNIDISKGAELTQDTGSKQYEYFLELN